MIASLTSRHFAVPRIPYHRVQGPRASAPTYRPLNGVMPASLWPGSFRATPAIAPASISTAPERRGRTLPHAHRPPEFRPSRRRPRHRVRHDACVTASNRPGFSMNLEPRKLRLAHAIADLGADVIEAGFPIASRRATSKAWTPSRARSASPVICGLARSAHRPTSCVRPRLCAMPSARASTPSSAPARCT